MQLTNRAVQRRSFPRAELLWSALLGATLAFVSCIPLPKDDSGKGGDAGEGGEGGDDGGSSSGNTGGTTSCQAPPACGGDPRGKWRITTACNQDLIGALSCTGVVGDGSGLTLSGTMTYNADNTYVSETDLKGTLKVTYPQSCLAGNTCASLKANFDARFGPEYKTKECVASANGGCRCTFELALVGTLDSGLYSTNGNVLTQLRADGISVQSDYCVRGTSMSQVSRNPSTGTIAQTIDLERQ